MRVLHAPTNIGNQPWTISRYERKLGIKSNVIVNYTTHFNYPADKVLGTYGEKSKRAILKRLYYGLSSPFTYDVLHYYFARSILYWDDWGKTGLPFFDLRLAKLLGKKIFFTLQGCDVRLAHKSNQHNLFTPCRKNGCSVYETCLQHYDAKRIHFIETILPLCHKVFYLNPELGHYVPSGQFLPYGNVDIDEIKPIYPIKNRIPKIVHAPSDGNIKGTPLILKALETLQKHYQFELILVQNKTHQEALSIYRSADIAIDQILAGWYGGVSVELMAMGKPVMCYIRESDKTFVPKQLIAELPIQNIRPDHLVEDIATILKRQNEWEEWGIQSRMFVERWHHPHMLARALIDAYKNPKAEFDLSKYIDARF